MDIPFLDLGRQYRRIRGEVCAAIGDVLARGRYILGDELAAFEREFAAYCEARHAVGVGSGTDAIHLALRACGVRPGEHVITAPNTATPTVCAIVQAGALPVFLDIDPTTYTLDPARLRAYLAGQARPFRAKAVVPVHLYGHPAHLKEILTIAAEYDVKVIEDAAQAHGAAYQGRRIGGWRTLRAGASIRQRTWGPTVTRAWWLRTIRRWRDSFACFAITARRASTTTASRA